MQGVTEIFFSILESDQARRRCEFGFRNLDDLGPVNPERIIRGNPILFFATTEFEVRLLSAIEGSPFPDKEHPVAANRMGDWNLNNLGLFDGARYLMRAEVNESL